MTTQSQLDALALLVLTTYDRVVDYWVSHGPRESRSEGSGVGDTIPRRGSTYEAHAIAGKHKIRREARREKDYVRGE
jgi:hypothetical protein